MRLFLTIRAGHNKEGNENTCFPSSRVHRLLSISSDPLSDKAIMCALLAASGSLVENILDGRAEHSARENKAVCYE